LQGGDKPLLPCVAVRPLRALCWVQGCTGMHVGLVNEDHAFDLLAGVLFSTPCGWGVHLEPACVRVCETNNLEVLPMYGGDGSSRRLV